MTAVDSVPRLVPQHVAASVDELLAGVTHREPFGTTDAKSGARLERVVIDGERFIVKYIHVDDDWTMRGSGDITCRPLLTYAAGLTEALPERIDSTVVGAAGGLGRNGWGAAILMRDVDGRLVPPGDSPLREEEHVQLIDDCAALCARMWGWQDEIGLLPYGQRWHWFSSYMIAYESARPDPEPVPLIARDGWERFDTRAPRKVVAAIRDLRDDPNPLSDALARTPHTFLHGDWKFGNVGHGADGRTLLIDWAYPGAGPACHELAWYLALNRARLPAGHTKEDTIGLFQICLERHGVATSEWWDRQLALCLLGATVQFGWEKGYDDDVELGWWCDRAREGLALL